MEPKEFIPEQLISQHTDTVEERSFANENEAMAFYKVAKKRVIEVNRWHGVSKMETSTFQLFDSLGNRVDRGVMINDFILIDIPSPGTKIGSGDDYVKAEQIEEISNDINDVFFYMRFRPSAPPGKPRIKTAHFFKADATSTFIVTLKGKTVSAEIHGRNEIPNIGADKLIDKARNTIIATTSFLGLSVLQWICWLKVFSAKSLLATYNV